MALQSKTLKFESSKLGGDVACTLLLCITGGDPTSQTVPERPIIWRTSLSATEISKATYVWNGRMAFRMHQIDLSPCECVSGTERTVKPGEKTSLVTEPTQCGSPPLYVFRGPTPYQKSSSVAAVNETDRTVSVSFGYMMNSGVIHDVRTWKNLGVGMRAEPDKKYLDPVLSIYLVHADTVDGEEIQTDKPIWKKFLSDIGPITNIRISRNPRQEFVADSKEVTVGCQCDADEKTKWSGCSPPTLGAGKIEEVKPPAPDQDRPSSSDPRPKKGKEPERPAKPPGTPPTPPRVTPPVPLVVPPRALEVKPPRAIQVAERIHTLGAQLTLSVCATEHSSTLAERDPSADSPDAPGPSGGQPPVPAKQPPAPATLDPVAKQSPPSKPTPPEGSPSGVPAPSAGELGTPVGAGPAAFKAAASVHWLLRSPTTHAERTLSTAIGLAGSVASAEQIKTIAGTAAAEHNSAERAPPPGTQPAGRVLIEETPPLGSSSGLAEQTLPPATPMELTVIPCALTQQMPPLVEPTWLPFNTQLLTVPVPIGWQVALLAALTGQISWPLASANAQAFYMPTTGNDTNIEMRLLVWVAGRRG